jgi:predicted DNA-binding transcriptional regulator AlpA
MTLLDATRAAARLGISRSTLAKMRVRGGGPRFMKLSGRVLYPESELEAWIGAQPLRASTSEYVLTRRHHTGRPRHAATGNG